MSLIFNGNADLDSVVYNGNEVEVVMYNGAEVWRRIKYVAVPTLSGTSYSTTGGTVGPTVNGFDSSIMTQEGTVSANWPGTYTVTWKLKDTKKYCWADGSTDAKSATWTVTGGSISFSVHLYKTHYQSSGGSDCWIEQWTSFSVPYGKTWQELEGYSGAYIEQAYSGPYDGWEGIPYIRIKDTTSTGWGVYPVQIKVGDYGAEGLASDCYRSGGMMRPGTAVATTDRPTNGATYYVCDYWT